MPTLLNRHTLIKRTYPHITCNLNGFLDKIWTFGIVCIWLCHKTDHGIAQLAFEMLFVFLHACPFVSKPARDEAPPYPKPLHLASDP